MFALVREIHIYHFNIIINRLWCAGRSTVDSHVNY